MNTASCGRNYNLSILLHLFFSSNILGMLLRRVTCFHQKNLTLKKKPPFKRHVCDTSQGEYALCMCSTCNSSFILPSFFVLFLLLQEVPEKSMFLFCLCYVGQLKGVIYE